MTVRAMARSRDLGLTTVMQAFYNPSSEGDKIEVSCARACAPKFILMPHSTQLSVRVPTVTATSARSKYNVTLHQAAVEGIFRGALKFMGVEVEFSTVPTSLDLLDDYLGIPDAYAVKVREGVLWFRCQHQLRCRIGLLGSSRGRRPRQSKS